MKVDRRVYNTRTYSNFSVSQCPKNYRFLEGDAVGYKWAIKLNGKYITHFASADDCAALCQHENECKAIEWSPTKHICKLISVSKPDGPKYQDYIFCSRQGII